MEGAAGQDAPVAIVLRFLLPCRYSYCFIGKENEIFRKTSKYALILLAVVIVFILIQAYVIPGVVPQIPVE
ncbi:MAG: hypothetical protein AB7E31_03990 [Desulfitobacterium sp.]